jgi:Family of unknown function (DUF6075)
MYFKNSAHKTLFEKMVQRLEEYQRTNREYLSFCYVVSATNKDSVVEYISSDGVELDKIKEEAGVFSSAEKALIELGYQLFRSGNDSLFKSDNLITDIMWPLDEKNMTVVMQALQFRYRMENVKIKDPVDPFAQ